MKPRVSRILVPAAVAAVIAGALYLVLPRLVTTGPADRLPPEPPPKDPELVRLEAKWGPKKYSQHDEELFILEFFDGRRDGTFVDIGAYDYKDKSNTYRLETELGWGGIAVDALEEFRAGYERHRPDTRFFAFYVSDTSTVPAEFFIVEGRRNQSTGVPAHAATKKRPLTRVEVPQITLDALLEREGIERIDFLNMDIEMAEPAALRGFDIDRYRPELVCIEAHPPIVDFLDTYFAEHGYVEHETWSRLDPLNSYYVRADLAGALEDRS